MVIQQAVLKVIEGTHTGNVVGVKAADDGIEGVVVHHRDPDIETGDVTFDHSQTGAQHTSGLSGQASSVGRVERRQDRMHPIQVRSFHLMPDWVVAMVGADGTVTTSPFTHQMQKALMWKKGW